MSLFTLGRGAPLRLRIHAGLRPTPREEAEDKRPLKPKRLPKTVPLFPDAGAVSTTEVRSERLARQVVQLCLLNPVNATILERFNSLGIADWWLTGGCLFQTVWNLRSGRPAGQGIKDYDIVYFADDPSWEAEDQVASDAERLFADLGVRVEVRNLARAELWFQENYSVDWPPVANTSEAIMRNAVRAAALGLKRTGDEFLDLFVPFGLDDVWNLIVTPNRAMPMAAQFADKVERWSREWPQLTIHPWADDAR